MSSFIRIAGAAALILSLGLFVSALPVTYANIQAPTGADAVSRLCAKLVVDGQIQAKLRALLLCLDVADCKAKIAIIITLLKDCANELRLIGVVNVDLNAKASLVACIVSIITLCAQVFIQLSLKFGLAICLDIDVALRLLLANLNICIDGILVLIAKGLASVTVGLLAKVNLQLCLGVLGL